MTVIEHSPMCPHCGVTYVEEGDGQQCTEGRCTGRVSWEATADAYRQQLQGAVCLTDSEWERVLYWLHKPVPPGPMKMMDEAIIRKITTQRGQ